MARWMRWAGLGLDGNAVGGLFIFGDGPLEEGSFHRIGAADGDGVRSYVEGEAMLLRTDGLGSSVFLERPAQSCSQGKYAYYYADRRH
jgi:hypothetical protein